MDMTDRLNAFDDSEEIAGWLGTMANDCETDGYLPEVYYLKEAEVHVIGLWGYAKNLVKEVRRLRTVNRKLKVELRRANESRYR
jgi:hypothetical protein